MDSLVEEIVNSQGECIRIERQAQGCVVSNDFGYLTLWFD